MSRKIRTRLRCKIIGSDYSAQEPRMNAHICEAYTNLPNKYYIDPASLPDKITSKRDIWAIEDSSSSISNTEYLVRLFDAELAKRSDDIDSAWEAVKAIINDPACNPKLCVNKMKEAYMADKDLYAMIAQSAFNNKYQDNLEFYPEFEKVVVDGHEIVCGSGESRKVELINNALIIPACYLVPTQRGVVAATDLTIADQIESDEGYLIISSIVPAQTTIINDNQVENIKIIFK